MEVPHSCAYAAAPAADTHAGRRARLYRRFGKRLLDITGSLLVLALLVPLLGIIALVVRSRLGGPVLFRQPRPGHRGRVFELLKFRTMRDLRDEGGHLLPDEARLTVTGEWLRRYSLDELPQLWNVLRGEMSLIGPRPLLLEYWTRYTPEHRRRHDVRPGITGWAQVHGRNETTWDARFDQDVWYVDNYSFGMDCRIVIETLRVIAQGRGGHDHARLLENYMGVLAATRGQGE